MSVFIRRCCKIAIFSNFLKVAIATSIFMNKVYNGRFVTELSVSVLKEIIALVQDYLQILSQKSTWNFWIKQL